MMPKGLGVELDKKSWNVPEIFTFLQEKGSIPEKEMYGVFNMGIGMALVVDEANVNRTLTILKEAGEEATVIGSVTTTEGVRFSS